MAYDPDGGGADSTVHALLKLQPEDQQEYRPEESKYNFPEADVYAPWEVADAISNSPNDTLRMKMSSEERSLRLYRIWLTGALQMKGAPTLSPNLCARRVANFWIILALMRSISRPVRGGIDIVETRFAVLLRSELLARGWMNSKTGLSASQFAERLSTLQSLYPDAPTVTITALVVALSEDPAPYTPEVTDESFFDILSSVDREDLRRCCQKLTIGPRAFRLKPSYEAGQGYEFLAKDPPTPGVCLRERADTASAWLSEESMERRLAHIYVYPRNLWL